MKPDEEFAAKVSAIEEFFEQARREEYEGRPGFMANMSVVHTWKIQDFIDAYNQGGYPEDHLTKSVFYAIDLKLQFYYIMEVDFGLYTASYGIPLTKTGLPAEAAPPSLLLVRLSQDQNLIGKIRVLWERLMNLVYFIEKRQELEHPKSKKGKFFRWVNGAEGNKWRFMTDFETIVRDHDNTFRTSEFHGSSTLRRDILERTLDPNEIISVGGLTYFLNGMWDNILSVMRGEGPVRPPEIDFKDDGTRLTYRDHKT